MFYSTVFRKISFLWDIVMLYFYDGKFLRFCCIFWIEISFFIISILVY